VAATPLGILRVRGSTGLYHLAILYPTQAELADALRRVLAASIELEGASDHGVSEAIYLRDPDGNGIELPIENVPCMLRAASHRPLFPFRVRALLISRSHNTELATTVQRSQSEAVKPTVEKACCRTGT
jgi:hypothetical protein